MNDSMVGERAWDSFGAYLFDIDGTLLNCSDAVHYFSFCDVLQKISGRNINLDGITAHGNTDIGILRDALQKSGIADEQWRPQLEDWRKQMGEFFEDHEDELCVSALPGVHQVLDHLRRKGAVLGLATGNLEKIGRLKLEKANILHYFSVAGWSDHYEYRSDVFRHAISQMCAATHREVNMCVFGDTPADVFAAHVNDLPIIAVATGVYTQAHLLEARPELCLPTLQTLLLPAI